MQLATAQKSRQRDIEKQVNALKKVSGLSAEADLDKKAHPNASTKAGMDDEINRTIDSIVRAWKKRYDEQQDLLTWPEGENFLSRQTCNFFSKIDVPEKVTDLGKGFEKYRKEYYDKIPNYMNKICRDVDVNWKFDKDRIAEEKRKRKEEMEESGGNGYGGGMGGGGMGGGGFGGAADDTTYIDELNRYAVNWAEENQMLWYQKLTQFQGYDDHSDAVLYPTYMQANMLQQDLWLLEAMFNNIIEINDGSTSNDTSVIRTIDHIVFGREVGRGLGELSEIDGRLGGAPAGMKMGGGPGGDMSQFDPPGGGGGGYGAAYGSSYGGGGMGPGGGGGAGEGMGERSVYEGRYVNPELEAISATDVRAVLGGAALPETNLELIVAKRVPFRLAVEMDERKINEFIAICANSEFVFEINQLRVNRHIDFPGAIVFNGGASANSGSGYGQGGGEEKDMSSGRSGGISGAQMGGGGAPGSKLTPTDVESRKDFMVSVEFYGIVKIYNPVRENFLRLAAGQNVVDETADPTMEAPVAQPAAGAAAPAAAAAQPGAAAPVQGEDAAPAAAPADAAPADAPADGNADNPAAGAPAPADQPAAGNPDAAAAQPAAAGTQ